MLANKILEGYYCLNSKNFVKYIMVILISLNITIQAYNNCVNITML